MLKCIPESVFFAKILYTFLGVVLGTEKTKICWLVNKGSFSFHEKKNIYQDLLRKK